MFLTYSFLRFRCCVAVILSLSLTLPISPAAAQPADSDFCVLGDFVAGVGQTYYQHNEIIIAEFREMERAMNFSKMRGREDAERIKQQLKAATEADPAIKRKVLSAIMETPVGGDHYHSCKRFKIAPVSGQYPIVYDSLSPRLVGDMCAAEPEFLFEIHPNRPIVIGARGVRIELQDFYDPDLSGQSPFSYAALGQRADRGDRLAALIRGMMGVRMMQCPDLPASMKFTAIMEGEPIMEASLLLLNDGIQLLTHNDETGRQLADAQRRASEQHRRRLEHASNWEERAAVGGALVISGMAIMLMHRCNDSGLPHPYLKDCE